MPPAKELMGFAALYPSYDRQNPPATERLFDCFDSSRLAKFRRVDFPRRPLDTSRKDKNDREKTTLFSEGERHADFTQDAAEGDCGYCGRNEPRLDARAGAG